jgi:hypothetical protein
MEARMINQPGTRLQAVVTTQIVSNDVEVALGIVGFDVGEQGDVALGIARGGAASQLFAITYP